MSLDASPEPETLRSTMIGRPDGVRGWVSANDAADCSIHAFFSDDAATIRWTALASGSRCVDEVPVPVDPARSSSDADFLHPTHAIARATHHAMRMAAS